MEIKTRKKAQVIKIRFMEGVLDRIQKADNCRCFVLHINVPYSDRLYGILSTELSCVDKPTAKVSIWYKVDAKPKAPKARKRKAPNAKTTGTCRPLFDP